jgi:ssRNA-specific RNase YbeY (16S rRNA maturation enzyme)
MDIKCESYVKGVKVNFDIVSDIVEETFLKNGMGENLACGIFLVSGEKMKELAEKYIGEEGEEAGSHPVLSFVSEEVEGKFVDPPDGKNYIGDIYVNWGMIFEKMKTTQRSAEDLIGEMAEHGALHLCGIHHD